MSVRDRLAATGPLVLRPHLDAKPWGGRRLERFGFDLPPDAPIGEALITAAEAVVARGAPAGYTLGEVVAANPEGVLGPSGLRATGGRPIFPLLIKLLDALEVLSIQVHPDDARAPAGSLGKTEAWHVLEAGPGAVLYLGLQPGVTATQLAALARTGASTAGLLREVAAVPGTTFLLPAGTVHALGSGIVIYEIQQPSAITYRFDDWGRVDASGRSRELHVEEALAVLDPEFRPEPIPPAPLPTSAGSRELLVSCRYFAAERIRLAAREALDLQAEGSPQALTLLSGTAGIEVAGRDERLVAGETAVTLAASGPARLRAETALTSIRGWVPAS
jgi:mannose-6-phosphate isomerase